MELNPNRGAGNREAEPLLQIELYSSSQDSLQQRTAWAISQLATRRYQASCRRVRAERPDSGSSCSSAPMCAICLEEFSEGQVRWARLEMEVVAGGGGVDRSGYDSILPTPGSYVLLLNVVILLASEKKALVLLRGGLLSGNSGTLNTLSLVSLMSEEGGEDWVLILTDSRNC